MAGLGFRRFRFSHNGESNGKLRRNWADVEACRDYTR